MRLVGLHRTSWPPQVPSEVKKSLKAGTLDDAAFAVLKKLEALCAKYKTTFAGVDGQIIETETVLRGLIDELTANVFDMQELAELKKLPGSE